MPEPRDHGPLPALLITLTVMTGLVDAFSYLALSRVFVANMTGNVLFSGFALAGSTGISVPATILALASFAAGAAAGGRWARTRAPHRGRLFAEGLAAQSVLVLVAAIVASATAIDHTAPRLVLVALLAVAMGLQNATVRRLAVPDLTTTVLTTTMTGLLADAPAPGVRARRFGSLAAMFTGAVTGGALLRWATDSAPLWVAVALLAGLAAAAGRAARRPGAQSWA